MNRYGSEPYKVQTQWLADNKKAFGLKFVVHLGDVVNNSVNEGQWKAADAAMSILEKGVFRILYSQETTIWVLFQ